MFNMADYVGYCVAKINQYGYKNVLRYDKISTEKMDGKEEIIPCPIWKKLQA